MNDTGKRPTVVLVLGIISIVWGLFGICSGIYGIATQFALAQATHTTLVPAEVQGWLQLLQAIGLVMSVILIVAGIGLVLVKHWAWILAMVYSVGQIPITLAGAAMMPRFMEALVEQSPQGANVPPQMLAAMKIGAAVGGACCGLIYPIVLIVVLNLKSVRTAFMNAGSAAPPPVGPQ